MSDAQTKAKPYSPEEMKAFKAWGERARAYYIEEGHPARAAADAWLRWDATFCQIEEVLAGVTAERDVLEGLVAALQSEETIANSELVQVNSALAQVESADNAALAKSEAERDAYKRIVAAYGRGRPVAIEIQAQVTLLRRTADSAGFDYHQSIIDALEALPR